MGLEKSLLFRGILIPRMYGTATHAPVNTQKNGNSFETGCVIKWYVIDTVNQVDYINPEPLTVQELKIGLNDIQQNIYTAIYNYVKATEPNVHDYLGTITMRS